MYSQQNYYGYTIIQIFVAKISYFQVGIQDYEEFTRINPKDFTTLEEAKAWIAATLYCNSKSDEN